MIKALIHKLLAKSGYMITRIDSADQGEQGAVIRRGKALLPKISPDLTVLGGPFEGMKYPSAEITELTLLPKIAGCYEMQLFPVIRELTAIPFDNIIDVGCAEGYYAVGLGSLFPQAIIHCYDVNEEDLVFCRQMGDLNSVHNLTYHNFCSPETLKTFDYGRHSLVFCDCEGYELDLFTEEAVAALANTHVLVELHDVLNPAISKTILPRFAASHEVRLLNNSDLDFAELRQLDHLTPAEKAFAVCEHRGGLYRNVFMEWALLTPRRNAS